MQSPFVLATFGGPLPHDDVVQKVIYVVSVALGLGKSHIIRP